MTLEEAQIEVPVTVEGVGGERSFRRRLMELGLLPGTTVTLLRTAPLGDPIEIAVRGCNLSIRKRDARYVSVRPAVAVETARTESAPGPQTAAARGVSS